MLCFKVCKSKVVENRRKCSPNLTRKITKKIKVMVISVKFAVRITGYKNDENMWKCQSHYSSLTKSIFDLIVQNGIVYCKIDSIKSEATDQL